MIARFLGAYPLPNRGDVYSRALNANALQRINNEEEGGRVEQDVSAKDRLLWSYQFVGQAWNAFQLVAGQNPDTRTKSHRARMTWLRQQSAATVMTGSIGFDRVGSLLTPDEGAVGPMVSTAGLTTLGPTGNIPIDRAQNVFRYAWQMEQTRGRHVWMVGGSVGRRQFNGIETDTHRGFFSFSNDYGRTGIENLRVGTPTQYIISLGDVYRGMRQWMPAVYAREKWKMNGRVTLTLGARYEWLPTPVEVNGRDRVAYGCDCNNVMPAVGMAVELRAMGRDADAGTVQYGEILPASYSQGRFSPPGSVKLAIPAADLLDPLRALKTSGQAPDAKGNLYLLDPEMASPYAYQYNFSWEPRLSKAWRLQLGYVGSRMHKLLVMWYLNRAHPVPGIVLTTATINQRRANADLAEIRWVLNGSRGYFDAGRVSLVAPRWKGVTVDAAYWFSKAMDLGADYTNTGYDADTRLSRSQSEYETHRDRKAVSQFHQPHAFLARVSWEMPAMGRGPQWWRVAARKWTTSAVTLWKTGTPFTVTTLDGPGFGNVDGNGNDRPNLLDVSVLGRTVGDPDTSRERLPARAFARIAAGAETGNLGANTFRKGAIGNVNAAVTRAFALWKEVRMNVRVESINVMNRPQFAEPGAVWGTPEFGIITNTLNEGRTFRAGLGVNW